MNIKNTVSYIIICIMGLAILGGGTCFSEDSNMSPYNKKCSATKTGRLVISPTSLQFYVNQEQNTNPDDIEIYVDGIALPNCTDANCTTEKIPQMLMCHEEEVKDSNNVTETVTKCVAFDGHMPASLNYKPYFIPIPNTDDLNAHNVIWPENLDFCWLAAPTEQWIKINNLDPGMILEDTDGRGRFSVTVDVKKLLDGNFDGTPSVKQGWIQVTTTIHDPSTSDNATYPAYGRQYVDQEIKDNITATLSSWMPYSPGMPYPPIPINQQLSTWWIPVTVYINSLRYAAEEKLATTDWMDLTLNVPVMDNTAGALYILAEHPSLAPGQVFAYRWVDGQPRFDLFSQWGHPVAGAKDLYYAKNIQATPIAIPFSNDNNAVSVIPYRPQNVGMSANTTDIKAFIPVPFGGGIRLIGMEGDWIIRALVGNPSNINDYESWRELLYYVLHIMPVTGRWVVTEETAGETFTYIDDATGIVYPLNLNEERGHLSGAWLTPTGDPVLAISYANSGAEQCNSFSIQNHRVIIDNCIKPGSYEIYFSQPSVWGMFDYYYRIDKFDLETGGKIEGIWKYRARGDDWSEPERFTAVTEDVTVPLDPSCNCYRVAGKVNGIATPFIVDTGAYKVLLNLNDAGMYGLVDDNGTISDKCYEENAAGVGGTVTGYVCPVDIEIDGVLKMNDVEAFLSANQDTALLGMTFLKYFHVTTNANDGTMIISK